MEIRIDFDNDNLYRAMDDSLGAFNQPESDWEDSTFTVILERDDGGIAGGARGVVRMGVVEIRDLWLDDELRPLGFDAQIVRTIESEARHLDARKSLLDTFSFKARDFYEKLNYVCFAEFDYPNGATRYYLSRML